MPDKKYTDDPAIVTLTGSEQGPIAQGGLDKSVTPNDYKAYTLNGYTGANSITTVGAVTAGTWSGRFGPRVVTDTTKTVLSIAPATTDIHVLTAQLGTCNVDIKIIPPPLHRSKVELIITDTGTPATLLFDPGTVRFNGVVDPGTTISNQTVNFIFEYNDADTIWDCILCTDDTGTSGPPTLTSMYIGYGDGSNLLTGTSDLRWDNASEFMVLAAALIFGKITSNFYGLAGNAGNVLAFYGGVSSRIFLYDDTTRIIGNVAIGAFTPTAQIHIAAGTATAGTAPLKLTAGTLLFAIEDGAIEYGSGHIYVTIGLNRYQLDQQATALLASVNAWSAANTFSAGITLNTVGLTLTNVNVVLGTSAGTKFGTSTSQKLAFFNSTPVVQPGATLELGTVLSNLGLRAVGSTYDITTTGAVNLVTPALGNNSTLGATTAFVAANSSKVYSGSFSGAGTATTAFTVSIGTTQANITYKVGVTPTSALSAALFYVTNKTTTTFDVTYLAGLTGTVTFDWFVNP